MNQAAQQHLQRAAGRRVALLQRALGHSLARTEAAVLSDELHRLGAPPSGSAFLAQRRELRRIERALALAEQALLAGQRHAQEGLREALLLLEEVAPELSGPIGRLCLDLPLDPGMGQRLPALVALLRLRQRAVPLLIGARTTTWKR